MTKVALKEMKKPVLSNVEPDVEILSEDLIHGMRVLNYQVILIITSKRADN